MSQDCKNVTGPKCSVPDEEDRSTVIRIARSGRAKDGGFTVLELVVLLVMLGVLLGVGIPVFINYLDSGSNHTAQDSALSALQAANSYYAVNGNSYAGLCPTPTCGAGPNPTAFAVQGAGVTAVSGDKSSPNPQTVSIWTSDDGLKIVIASLANDTHNCWVVIEERNVSRTDVGFKGTFPHLYIREKPAKGAKQATCNAGADVFLSSVPDVTNASLTGWPPAS
jgi:type II secretory pathway pseudopilin PulG